MASGSSTTQHQFSNTHLTKAAQMDHSARRDTRAALITICRRRCCGSGNIGTHRIHNLSSRVLFYRLPKVLHEHPEFADIGGIRHRRMTLVSAT
jgi:fatty acid desaturase